MTFKDALTALLDNLLVVLIFPKWMMKWVPNKTLNETYEAYVEWGQYMREMYVKKRDEVRSGEEGGGMDLMGALVRGAGFSAETKSDTPPSSPTEKLSSHPSLPKPVFNEQK